MTEAGDRSALQFEKAETEESPSGPMSCAFCADPIRGVYYQVGGAVACEGCRERKLAEKEVGSGLARWARAAALGTGAAIVGALIWYLVAELTGYEFGLIAIVIGLLVGGAVRFGSRRRGGWVYQGLAMFLTYASIVSTYVPAIFEGLAMAAESEGVETESGEVALASVDAAAEGVDAVPVAAAAGESLEAVVETDPEAALEEGGPVVGGLLGAVIGLGLLAVIVFAAPFLAGFENFMGWIILAIGLYEAWKLNRRETLIFEGPFRLAGTRPEYRPEPPPAPITPA
jgi:hypothetical protein